MLNNTPTIEQVKDKLTQISAKIGQYEIMRSQGKYASMNELRELRNQFGKLSKTYMKMKKIEMEKKISSYKG